MACATKLSPRQLEDNVVIPINISNSENIFKYKSISYVWAEMVYSGC